MDCAMNSISSAADTSKIYAPTSLAMRVSYKCNIGCRFCYNLSLPNTDLVMKEDQLLDILEQCRDSGIDSVGFSGGEVFLFAPALLRCVRKSRDLGYRGISIVTNGFWGKNPESASRTIKALAENGFEPPRDRLSMSAGEFHNEFLDWSYAKNIAKEYFATFGHPLRIDFEITPGKDNLVDEFKAYLKDEGIAEEAYKLDVRRFIANIGRWKEKEGKPVGAKPLSSFRKCNAINRFVVDPDGKVMPCCGFNRFIDGISLGNLNHDTVAEVIERAQSHIPTRLLNEVPMDALHRELSQAFDLPTQFWTICEVCEAIFGNPAHVRYLESRAEHLLAQT
jgi:MoaA/NifB/PqqE/SkfB family radical SAM enzyme